MAFTELNVSEYYLCLIKYLGLLNITITTEPIVKTRFILNNSGNLDVLLSNVKGRCDHVGI